MAVPTSRTDLSATIGSNSPLGSETISSGTGPDEYLRAHAAFIRQNYDDIKSVIVSVKDYGAVGNGVANDTTAIQDAIDYVCGLHGGVVHFPIGSYKITSALSITSDGVTLRGDGVYGEAGFSGTAGATAIRVGACDFITSAADINNLSIENMFIIGSDAATAGDVVNVTANMLNNFSMTQVYATQMNRAIHVAATGIITCGTFTRCQFSYNRGWHVDYDNGATLNAMAFYSCRFEQSNGGLGAYRAVGNAIATGSHNFISCVFEGFTSANTVDLGNNAVGVSFFNCHFESNAVGVDGGCDIYLGSGYSTLEVRSCNFSLPYSTATNFYNIRLANSGARVTISGNYITGMGQSGYLGFVSSSLAPSPVLCNNVYRETGSPWIDYLNGTVYPTRSNDFQNSGKAGAIVGPVHKYVQTTDATATTIYGDSYAIAASSINYYEAKVAGVDSTGANYYSATLRKTYSADGSNTITDRGDTNETAIAAAGMAAAFSISGSGASAYVLLKVTGVAASTIKWTASVTLQRINH